MISNSAVALHGMLRINRHILHCLFFKYGGIPGSSDWIRSPVFGSNRTTLARLYRVLNHYCYSHFGAIIAHLACGTISSTNFVNLFSWESGGWQ